MEQAVQQLKDWLNSESGQTVVITKQELDDVDTVHFSLESVDYRGAEEVIDDYLGDALILRGSGNTLNGDGELVPLPQPSYEIAVSGLQLHSAEAERAELQTDRAKYTLSFGQA
ncbi:hypothetical protein [Paenibacillus camerounensis]|uniref:hypothetical protein n=1 Tax=Paenibacillus camerounensis TaxID=1243663 RepID=UPI0005A7074C|nr:hypothetical protein [Paenibacillus camerounensis]